MILHNLKIHHIGYLVKNIANASEDFEKLGYSIIKNIGMIDILYTKEEVEL